MVSKVLHLSSEKHWRGGEQQIAYLIDELKKRNVESFVCARKGSAFEKYCITKSIPVQPLGFSNSLDLSTALGIRRSAKRWGVEIIHIHSAKSHWLAILASVFGCSLPMVFTRRVNFALSTSFFTRWKYNHPAIKKIICISKAIEHNMKAFVLHPDRCTTVYSGIDLLRYENVKPFDFRKQYGWPPDAVIIGATAALDESKDPFTFISVIKKLSEMGVPVRGVLVGDGPLRTDLERVIKNESLENKIILTGYRTDAKELLRGFNYFLLTSIEEGLGTSVLDAFLANVPVVATDVGGIPEMVQHEVTGMIAPAKDVTALANGILQLHQSQALKGMIVNNAAKAVLQFSKENMAEKTLTVYNGILAV